jgi:hypothetical protein
MIDMIKYFTYLFCLLVFSSCIVGEHEGTVLKRTVFVYIGRDNSLRGLSEEKIESLKNGWDGQNGHLVIYQDLYEEGSVLQEIYVENGIKKSREIEAHAQENSASPEVFARVLKDVIALYPADSYGLIVFSHASGWLPDASLSSPRSMTRSLVQDGTDWMSLTDFAAAIPDRQFEFVIFEACFMGGIEVAYELRNKTEYIVASSAEMLSPGFQGAYESSVNELYKEKANLQAFTKNTFDAINARTGEWRSATFSIIKTDGLEELSDWIRANIAFDQEVDINDIQHFDRYSYHLFFDFEDYFSHVLKDDGTQNKLTQLVNNCIVYKASTPEFMPNSLGFGIVKHSGLTTYIRQNEYPYLNSRYEELAWFKNIYVIN